MINKLNKIRYALPIISENHRIALGFLTSFILFTLIFFHSGPNESITLWDRTIGPATLAGIDIQKRTSYFSTLMFFWIPFVGFTFSYIYSKLSKRTINPKVINISLLNLPIQSFVFYFALAFSALYLIIPLPDLNLTALPLTIHGGFFLVISSIAIFATKKTNIFNTTIKPLFNESSIIFLILLFIDFSTYTSEYLIPFLATKSDLYKQVLNSSIQDFSLSSIMLALGSFLLIDILDTKKNWPIKNPAKYICIFLCTSLSINYFTNINFNFSSFITFLFFIITSFYFTRNPLKTQLEWFHCITSGFVWIPAIISICLEFFFILTEKELVLPQPWLIIFIICSIFLLLQKKLPTNIYAGTLVSLCSIAFFNHTYQQIWDFNDYAYLYEMGNKTVALGTILHGNLPIIDYFSAHALFDIWTQILYAFVNPSIEGILANPYGGLNELFAILILYFILSKIVSKNVAILFIVLFPLNVLGIKAYNICFIAILAYIFFQKEFTLKKSFLFWFVIAINAFMLYDDGVSLGIASIITTCIMFICNRDKVNLIKFLGVGFIVGILFASIALILSTIRGISPLDRLNEWLNLTLKSNAIWATASIGNPHSIPFIFSYFIAPATASFALYYTIYKSFLNKKLSIIAGVTITFAIAELLFIPRGITFHNLTESNGIAGRLLNFWPWTISCFTMFLLEERNYIQTIKNGCWIFIFGLSLYISATFVTHYLPNANSQLANTSINASSEFHSNKLQTTIEPRIVYTKKTSNFVKMFKNTLDSILKPSETFLDFSNSNALYAMVNRPLPSYAAQTPGLLSTIFSQNKFLDQIKNESAPIAIIGNANLPYLREMTWEPHNIPHNIRYYSIAEYIYENYKPYKIIGDYALWCKKERCKDFLPYDYDANIKHAHHYSLDMLPFIWANYDNFNAISNQEITLETSNIQKKGAYLNISIANTTQQNAFAQIILTDPNTDHSIIFDFTVIPGQKLYLIRISADSYWYGYNLSEIQLNGEGISLKSYKFLKGD